jgi:hypothetical protein
MKIELRNVKYAAFASEETACFSATVVLDGKPAGTVSNDGHGGPDMHHPLSLEERLNAYAKTLPSYVAYGETFEHNAETVIGDLLDEHLLKRDYKRLVASRVLFVGSDGKLYQSSKLKKPQLATLIEKTKARSDVGQVLNTLPEDEGFALFKTMAKVA